MRSIDLLRSFTTAGLLSGFTSKQSMKPAILGMLFAATLAAQSPLVITTASPLPTGTVGASYAAQLAASGGTPPYSWSSSGGLPPGLTVASSGVILGTPTVGGPYTVTIFVTDSRNSTASKQFNLAIGGGGGGGSNLSITTTSLPAVSVNQAYNQTVSASGGTPPYTWSLASGSLPAGLALAASAGVISGTPTAAGTSSFTLRVTDSTQTAATANLALTVNPAALQITGPVGSLFNGTVGAPYSPTTFSAQGGAQPYTWSILSGNPDGLTINSSTGILSGTPLAAGTFSFVVQVADSAGAAVSQSFSIVVNNQSLIITAASFPTGQVNVPYSQTTPAATVTGGTAPYIWSLASGSIPGLTFVPVNVAFTGTPTTPGTFPITLQVSDSTGLTATKAFTVTITPAALSFTTSLQLPSGTLNLPYSQQISATGGAPPYTWSANGLPKGLAMNSSTGLISGTPTTAGTFSFVVITVIDSALKSALNNFTLIINVPPAPPVTISGLPSTAAPAGQFPLQVALGAPYTTDITGQLVIGFQANTGLGDSTIQFSTGGKTANFTIPTGSTAATFVDSNGIPVAQLQIQVGTVAGSISVSIANISAGGVDITPNPAPSVTTQIAAAAPVIQPGGVLITRNGTGGCPTGQICIQTTGFATSREVTQAVYTFTAASGQTLQSSAGSITVDVSSLFTTWFGSSVIGSQFILNQPFTVQGDPNAVTPTSVTLTNRLGSTTFNISQ